MNFIAGLTAAVLLCGAVRMSAADREPFPAPVREDSPETVTWMLPDSVMSRDFSLFTTVIGTSAKPGREDKFGYPGDRFGPMILRFVKDGGDVVLQQAVSPGVTPDFPENLRRLCSETGYVDVWRFPVSEDTDGGTVIDVSSWLDDDYFFGLQAYSFLLRIGQRVSPASGSPSGRTEIVHRDGQVIVRSDLNYAPMPLPGVSRDTSRWRIGTCLTLLPRRTMKPVYADARVGYFHVPSWKPGASGMDIVKVPAVKKFRNGVTLHVFPGFPEHLLPSVRRAVENWDRIFRYCGLSGHVRLVEPSEEDMASGKYSVDDARISWIKYNNAPCNENAYGRNYADLRSGEILCACLGVFSGVDRNIRGWYLSQTGDIGPVPEDMYNALFEMAVTHEIGHILGLEHNFYGSRMFSVGELRDSVLMSRMSHGSSIMDYMRLNYAAMPGDGIAPLDLVPGIGPYDRAAMVWAYGDRHAVRKWCRNSGTWNGRFPGTGKTCFRDDMAAFMFSEDSLRYLSSSARDIQVLSEDLGSDPVSTAWLGMEHICTALDSLHESAEDGRQAADSAFVVTALKKQYRQFVGHAVSHFGGVMRIPDGDGNVVTVPVDSASVSAAAEFVDRFVFNPPSWAGDMTDGDYAAEVRSMIERRTVRRAKPEGSREPDTCGGVFYVADSCRVAGPASPAGAAGDAEGILGNGDFRVKVADGTVVLETGAPGRFHAAVQIDSGAGLRARPLSCVSFDAEGRADITGILSGILVENDSGQDLGLTFFPDGDMFRNASCSASENGWLIKVRTMPRYGRSSTVAEMVPRSGSIPVTLSFSVSRLRETVAPTVIAVDRSLPGPYRRTVLRTVRQYGRDSGTGTDAVVVSQVRADCPAAVSFDIAGPGVDVFCVPGFFRVNIGAGRYHDRDSLRSAMYRALEPFTGRPAGENE